jgi:sortase A
MITQEKILKICGVIMGISGVVIISSTLYPILSYEWESAKKYPTLISPLVDEETAAFKFSKTDYTKASNWFPEEGGDADFTNNEVLFFTISIPKLGIDNASVSIGGENLSDSLIQYPGTALPGKNGNAVIFGHSVLPQYFDPSNYLSIFSTLPELSEGDLVYTNFDGIMYKYIVEDMFEVTPKDIQILEQDISNSYITLVTCTPPGHPLKPKRLIVRARLIPSNKDVTIQADETIRN